MNRGIKIVIILVIIAILLIAAPMINARILSDKHLSLAKENQCILENGDELIFSSRTPEYKCQENPQLEEQLNSYLNQVDNWFFIWIISVFVLMPILILIIFIYCIYRLGKWILRQK
ncbi:hypothetical protein, partial [Hyella patelloides]|uniref:hypothetical protein n=1 Tax=Hyella patelloides TaxID=1982969 RepID=UPI001C938918